MSHIEVLPPAEARLIAAGEVIDRPASALRELLDNALDAGSSAISVEIEEGGNEKITVTDDGIGMSRKDLELCTLPHATSKIRRAQDLLQCKSLGFRGEALNSIAAVAHIEITTCARGSTVGYVLTCRPDGDPEIVSCARNHGTTVVAKKLFADFPARRQFLKRAQAEAALCKQAFEEKALAYPDRKMSYSTPSGVIALPAHTYLDRIRMLCSDIPLALTREITLEQDAGTIVLASPSHLRSDRKHLRIFINRRKVMEYSLVQAVEYAFSDYLPGSYHPCAFVFLEIDPALVDFNIHPAKKEVRLKDPDRARKAVISAIRSHLGARPNVEDSFGYNPQTSRQFVMPDFSGSSDHSYSSSSSNESRPEDYWKNFDQLREKNSEPYSIAPRAVSEGMEFRYLGQVFNLFLIFESNNTISFLDQHAAHERIIFDEISSKEMNIQELLIPAHYEPENDAEDRTLTESVESLKAAGFLIERGVDGWDLLAVPGELASDPIAALQSLLQCKGDAIREARSLIACKLAIKEGATLDPGTACELISKSLQLPQKLCPHGRPIMFQVSEERLLREVRRIK